MQPIKLSILAFAFLNIVSCSNRETINETAKQNLKGKVKSVIEAHYNLTDGDITLEAPKLSMTLRRTFNPDGNKLEEAYLGPTGKIDARSVFKYDNSGYTISALTYNSGDIPKAKFLFTNDRKGNKISEQCFERSNPTPINSSYSYDEYGNRKEWLQYNRDGSLSSKSVYAYDKQNRLIQTLEYDENKLINKTVFKYAGLNQPIETDLILPEQPSKRVFKYNAYGDPVEEVTKGFDGKKWLEIRYTYEGYDKNENWLKRTNNYDGRPGNIIERKITYY
jgi:hypothetical protein